MIRDIEHPESISSNSPTLKSSKIDNNDDDNDDWNNPEKRLSLYSQLSLESIDSHLDVVDNCTFNDQQRQVVEQSESVIASMMERVQISAIELPVDPPTIQSSQMIVVNDQEKRKESKPLKRRSSYLQSLIPIRLQHPTTTPTPTLTPSPQLSIRANIRYDNSNNINENISKAKSDTQLFFCLYDDDYSYYYGDDQFGIGNESDRQLNQCRRHCSTIINTSSSLSANGLKVPESNKITTNTSKRNSQIRASFYEKWLGINNNKNKRQQQSTPPPCSSMSTTSSSSSSSATDSMKRKFKFRYSSKVSRKIAERLHVNSNNNENDDDWHRTKREKSSSTPLRSCSLRYRASEPAINNCSSSSSSLSRKCRRNGFIKQYYDDYDYYNIGSHKRDSQKPNHMLFMLISNFFLNPHNH